MALFTLYKTNKKEKETTLLGQSTDPALLADAARRLNDNTQFVIKKDGSIAGKESMFDIVEKDLVKSTLGYTVDLENQD